MRLKYTKITHTNIPIKISKNLQTRKILETNGFGNKNNFQRFIVIGVN